MKKMKKGIGAFVISVLLFCLFTPQVAFAADVPSITVPVEISLEGNIPSTPETYDVILKADSAIFPMPEGSTESMYTLSITGASATAFPTIMYSAVGVYTYTITQKSGTNLYGTYDTTVYQLTVYVTNNESGGLEATAVMHLSGTADKPTLALFTNSYRAEPVSLIVEKKWVDNGKNRPSSVNVALYNGKAAIETIKLDGSNNWKYEWQNLDGSGDWTVQEVGVPQGYSVSYTYKDGYILITNTASLIQTGQLNWPIPVLSAVGLMLIIIGVIRMTKRKRNGEAE